MRHPLGLIAPTRLRQTNKLEYRYLRVAPQEAQCGAWGALYQRDDGLWYVAVIDSPAGMKPLIVGTPPELELPVWLDKISDTIHATLLTALKDLLKIQVAAEAAGVTLEIQRYDGELKLG